MLFPAMAEPGPPALHEPGLESLLALEGLNGSAPLHITCRHLVGIFQASRALFMGSPERREEFDALGRGCWRSWRQRSRRCGSAGPSEA